MDNRDRVINEVENLLESINAGNLEPTKYYVEAVAEEIPDSKPIVRYRHTGEFRHIFVVR